MGVFTGDLSPRASGSASLGVEMINGMGGFTTDIRPYAHVHMNSGVWHDPLHGESGVLRFDQGEARGFECSVDGGLTFGVLPHSGQVQESIEAALIVAGATPHTLQAAYDGGDEILMDRTPNDDNRGVIVREQEGVDPAALNESASIVHLNYGVAVSGATGANGFAFSKLMPNGLSIKSSGTSTQNETVFAIGYLTDPTVAFFATDAGVQHIAEGDINMLAGLANQPGGQIALHAFLGSGQLEYRFGPHQSWHMKQSHSSTSGPLGDGFNPLVPSGQIIQMILENVGDGASTLQEAYENGQTIFIDSPDLTFAAGAGKFRLSTDGARAELNISGLLSLPHTDREIGDINFVLHGAGFPSAPVITPADAAEATAQALGIGDVTITTASGVVNLMMASGIGEFTGFAVQSDLSPVGTDIPWNWARVNRDRHFLLDTNRDVVFLAPGWYKVTYGVSFQHSASASRTIIRTRARVNGAIVQRSTSFCYSRNTTASESSSGRTFTINIDPSDILSIESASLDATTQAGASSLSDLLIERLGPRTDMVETP